MLIHSSSQTDKGKGFPCTPAAHDSLQVTQCERCYRTASPHYNIGHWGLLHSTAKLHSAAEDVLAEIHLQPPLQTDQQGDPTCMTPFSPGPEELAMKSQRWPTKLTSPRGKWETWNLISHWSQHGQPQLATEKTWLFLPVLPRTSDFQDCTQQSMDAFNFIC